MIFSSIYLVSKYLNHDRVCDFLLDILYVAKVFRESQKRRRDVAFRTINFPPSIWLRNSNCHYGAVYDRRKVGHSSDLLRIFLVDVVVVAAILLPVYISRVHKVRRAVCRI